MIINNHNNFKLLLNNDYNIILNIFENWYIQYHNYAYSIVFIMLKNNY